MCLSDGTEGSYAAPILENSDVPGLLGLESLKKHRALMDTYNGRLFFIGPGGYQLNLSPGSKVFELEESPSKHWLLPCTEWPQAGTENGQTVIRGIPARREIPPGRKRNESKDVVLNVSETNATVEPPPGLDLPHAI